MLSQTSLNCFQAICDTFVNVRRDPNATFSEKMPLLNFHPDYKRLTNPDVCRIFNLFVPKPKTFHLKLILWLLSSRLGTLLLTGYFKPFERLAHKERETALLHWKHSIWETKRMLFEAFRIMAIFQAYMFRDEDSQNKHWERMEYEPPSISAKDKEKFSGKNKTFDFVKASKVANKEFDAVVIGSGAGGGVVAAELSEAGFSVLVVEKGVYKNPGELDFSEEGSSALYQDGGLTVTEDGSLAFFSGSTFGGGTRVNWSASLVPPKHLREEWSRAPYHLSFVTSSEFQKGVERVCESSGVSTDGVHYNVPNQILLEGCAVLNYPAEVVPQNCRGVRHECAHCHMGCSKAIKQSTDETFLKHAAKAGAQFILETKARKVIYNEQGNVTGVLLNGPDGNTFTVRTRCVVSSCGSFETPALLLRSGLKNPNIGKNLRVHPAVFALGHFPNRDVNASRGPILTTLCRQVEDLDGRHYGAKLETPPLYPALYATMLNWRSSVMHTLDVAQLRHMSPIVVLCRDTGSGIVTLNEDGHYTVNYTLNEQDKTHMVEGLVTSLNILHAAGASRLYTTQFNVDPLDIPDQHLKDMNYKGYHDFIEQVRQAGIKKYSSQVGSAHIMGSCRMASTPEVGAINPLGECWDVKGLFVADASTFPTASGVNPMITVQSMAFAISQNIKSYLETTRKQTSM
jgi:choline dehydrogenase-like flavoprotein